MLAGATAKRLASVLTWLPESNAASRIKEMATARGRFQRTTATSAITSTINSSQTGFPKYSVTVTGVMPG